MCVVLVAFSSRSKSTHSRLPSNVTTVIPFCGSLCLYAELEGLQMSPGNQ